MRACRSDKREHLSTYESFSIHVAARHGGVINLLVGPGAIINRVSMRKLSPSLSHPRAPFSRCDSVARDSDAQQSSSCEPSCAPIEPARKFASLLKAGA